MTKPRLVKVGALFYVFQQVTNSDEKRVHQNFDTPSGVLMGNGLFVEVGGEAV